MRYLIGLVGFPLGILIIVYRERVKRFTGDVDIAEKYLGVGGTYTAILIFGLLVSIGSLMYMFGTFQAMIRGIAGPLFG